MGQRLNVEIRHKGKTLANSYYHWSAYTVPAAAIATQIVLATQNISLDEANLRKTATLLLYITGARLMEDQEKYAKKYGFTDEEIQELSKDINRTTGLIALRPVMQKDLRSWEEGRVIINLDKKTVNFGVLWWNDKEDICSNYPTWKMPINRIPFEKMPAFLDFLEKSEKGSGEFTCGKNCYTLIQ